MFQPVTQRTDLFLVLFQYGRTPLADNSRFLYEDDTASISDGHIVNIYGYSDNQTFGDNRDYENTQGASGFRADGYFLAVHAFKFFSK